MSKFIDALDARIPQAMAIHSETREKYDKLSEDIKADISKLAPPSMITGEIVMAILEKRGLVDSNGIPFDNDSEEYHKISQGIVAVCTTAMRHVMSATVKKDDLGIN